jgi:two-component system nitrate/nitrite response regulator NarP
MGGHEVAAMTGDGDETLEAIERLKPDVVLLDVRMPGRDGISTLEELRKRGDSTPVIILTVELTDNQLLSAIRAHVNGIVFKHDAEDRLLKAIETVLNGMRYLDGDLIDKAISQASVATPASRLARLTSKELDVAQHVARGLRNREVASLLGTTEGTVKVYLHNIYTKLGISNRTELAMMSLNEQGE